MINQDYYLLDVKNLSVFKIIKEERVKILDNISFKLKKNEILTIIGATQSGKSFLILVLFRLIDDYKNYIITGDIFFYCKELGRINLITCSDKQINFILKYYASIILQNPTDIFNQTFTINKQLINLLKNTCRISYREAAKRYYNMLQTINIKKKTLFKRYPIYLKESQKQKIVLAFTKLLPHTLIIIDQPIYTLESNDHKEVIEIIENLKLYKTIIFINNNLSFLPFKTDKILIMKNGCLMEQNTLEQLFTNPKTSYTQALIASRPRTDIYLNHIPKFSDLKLHKCSETISPIGDVLLDCYVSQEQVIKYCREINKLSNILEIKNLDIYKYVFGFVKEKKHILKNISFVLHETEILGIIGKENSSKRHLVHAILNQNNDFVQSGEVLLEGKQLETFEQLRNIQLIDYESYKTLHPDMTIKETLTEMIKSVDEKLTNNELDNKIFELLEVVNLSYIILDKYPNDFTKEQQLNIVLIRALSVQPKILVFYKPTVYLDSLERANFLNLLKLIHKKKEITYIYASNNLADIHFLSQRVMVLDKGDIVEIGNTPDIFQHSNKPVTEELINNFIHILPQDIRNKHIDNVAKHLKKE